MPNILWFRDIRKEDVAMVGGKGANLGEMSNAGFPIPPGFCVTIEAYWKFLEETGLKKQILERIDAIDVENTEQLEKVTAEVRELIRKQKMSKELETDILKAYAKLSERKLGWLESTEKAYVAVRSSASAEDLPSIAEDEPVLVKINDEPVYDSVKNIYRLAGNNGSTIEVVTMEDNKVKWNKVENFYKHKAKNDKLLAIKTSTGRTITVSPNHSLITLDENLKPKVVESSLIKIGDKVPVTKSIPLIGAKEPCLNVLDFVKGNDVTVIDGKVYIKNKHTNWKTQNGLNQKIPLNNDFAYFLGVFIAEGSTYKDNGIIITNSDKLVRERTKRFLESLGLWKQQKINKHSIRVYCRALARLLHEITGKPREVKGKGRSCRIKRVPNFVFGWGKEMIRAFLRGCFDGDGWIQKGNIGYASMSKKLAGGIIKLLELLGIEFYIREKKNKSFKILIPYKEAEKFKELIGFQGKKTKKLEELIAFYNEKRTHPDFKNKLIVSSELSEKIRAELISQQPQEKIEVCFCPQCSKNVEQSSYYSGRKRHYCRNCKKVFYDNEVEKGVEEKHVYYDEKGLFKSGQTPWNKGKLSSPYTTQKFKKKMEKYGTNELTSAFEGNVLWDEIKEIVPVNYNGWVYDFSVPEVENFAAGVGGIITHNSASFAGQQETYLNIVGDQAVLKAVKDCWASLFTARATYYRKKQGFSTEKVGISVVVQKMVDSEIAGVMFTADPTGDETKIIIEAAYGLGDMVVSGSITPDTYVLDKGSVKIISKRIAKQSVKKVRKAGKTVEEKVKPSQQEKQKLADKFITDLARIGKQIENHYKTAQDIEWALEEGLLYIVQSRGVTTLEAKKKALAKEKRIIKAGVTPLLRGSAASPGIASGIVRVIPSVEEITRVKEGEIIATIMTSPDWVPVMRKSKAIITNEGGNTCHAAIVSRELGVPCVVGTINATKELNDGETITVDGFNGVVYRGEVAVEKPVEVKVKEIIKKEEVGELEEAMEKEKLTGVAAIAAEVVDKIEDIIPHKEKTPAELEEEKKHLRKVLEKRAVKVKVNVALPDAAKRAAETGADGVGLLRAEHMITEAGVHPAEFLRQGKKQELVKAVKNGVKKVVELFKDKPIWYRTFDARTDEFRHLKGGETEPEEDNPMLGWHGIRRSLDEPELIKAEFAGIKELVREGFKSIGVMLPFLINTEELRKAKSLARSAGLKPHEEVAFGVMIETPASVWIIDELIEEGIDFISFGTNDLTQLTLGIDRNNERIQKLFNARHAAILGQLDYVIKKCKKAGVTTSICGQAGSDPEMVRKLVRMGIDSVSANIDAVKKIKETVLLEEKKMILEKIHK